MQTRSLIYHPVHGAQQYLRLTADEFRKNGGTEWQYNPWTGERRNVDDIRSDPQGLLIHDGSSPIVAFKQGAIQRGTVYCQHCTTVFTGTRCPTCHGSAAQDDRLDRCLFHPRYSTKPFCPDCQSEKERANAREALQEAAEKEPLQCAFTGAICVGGAGECNTLGCKRQRDLDVSAVREMGKKISPEAITKAREALACTDQIPGVKSIDTIVGPQPGSADHPLQDVFALAIEQATRGKGVRHGGDATPFLEQPWTHYGKMHGRGFLTGQAAKKLEEAANTRKGEAFIAEALGALVYIGMAILKEQGKV